MSDDSHQLPSSVVAREFGEVNVRRTAQGVEVLFTVLMEPQGIEAEGWQTGVALDASASMKGWFGQQLDGKIPPELAAEYEKQGWIVSRVQDGRNVRVFQRQAYEDAMKRGHLRMSQNIVQTQAREFISYLAANLDADGGTTVIYWACGDGAVVEVVGDFTHEQCQSLVLTGPKSAGFGGGTQLLPAVQYFADRFQDAARGMYLFITDGRLDDLEAVKAYTVSLAREIAAKKRNPVKCVLIGVGNAIDEGQMEELDDLDTGTEVDIWDHKVAAEMRGTVEIFAEVVSENQIVAPMGMIYDSRGKMVKQFTDGVPAKINVTLSPDAEWFELEVGGQRIRQTVLLPVGHK